MKTPMQEHIEWLKKEWKKLESVGELGVALHIGDCIEHAESLLEKEKVNRRELLLDFADYSERDKTSQTTDECVDNYFDSIFKTKER